MRKYCEPNDEPRTINTTRTRAANAHCKAKPCSESPLHQMNLQALESREKSQASTQNPK